MYRFPAKYVTKLYVVKELKNTEVTYLYENQIINKTHNTLIKQEPDGIFYIDNSDDSLVTLTYENGNEIYVEGIDLSGSQISVLDSSSKLRTYDLKDTTLIDTYRLYKIQAKYVKKLKIKFSASYITPKVNKISIKKDLIKSGDKQDHYYIDNNGSVTLKYTNGNDIYVDGFDQDIDNNQIKILDSSSEPYYSDLLVKLTNEYRLYLFPATLVDKIYVKKIYVKKITPPPGESVDYEVTYLYDNQIINKTHNTLIKQEPDGLFYIDNSDDSLVTLTYNNGNEIYVKGFDLSVTQIGTEIKILDRNCRPNSCYTSKLRSDIVDLDYKYFLYKFQAKDVKKIYVVKKEKEYFYNNTTIAKSDPNTFINQVYTDKTLFIEYKPFTRKLMLHKLSNHIPMNDECKYMFYPRQKSSGSDDEPEVEFHFSETDNEIIQRGLDTFKRAHGKYKLQIVDE